MRNLLILLFSTGLLACSTTHHRPLHPAIFHDEKINDYSGYVIHITAESIYVGHVKNGEPHGKGTAYVKGTYMTGHWVNGQLNGEGIIMTPKIESVSVGQFREQLLSGEGYIKVKEEEFFGLFKGGLPSGKAYCYKNKIPQPCSNAQISNTNIQ